MAIFDVVVAEVDEHGQPVRVVSSVRSIVAQSSREAARKAVAKSPPLGGGARVNAFIVAYKAEPM